jgi:hypothetical protein
VQPREQFTVSQIPYRPQRSLRQTGMRSAWAVLIKFE